MHVTNLFTDPEDLMGQEHSRFLLNDLKPEEITKILSQVNKFDKSKRNSSRFTPISNEWRLGLKFSWEPGFLRMW